MKSKKVIWLTVMVLIIWGTIGFKIITGMAEGDAVYQAPVVKHVHFESESKEMYPLSLNYDDPFFKKNRLVLSQPTGQKKVGVKSVPKAVQVNWSNITYRGCINNASRRYTIASLQINGNDYMVKTGDLIEGFQIGTIYGDSVQMIFETHKMIIKREK